MPRRRLSALAVALAALVVVAAGCARTPDDGAKPITLALDFQPNAVHAAIYAAMRERLDRARGIRLRVRVPSSSSDSLKLLAAGRADAAVVDIHDLGLARERGADVVGIGALVQRPLAAVIADRSIRRPRDLEGRRVGVTGAPSDDAVLRAAVESDGGEFSKVRRTTIGFSAVQSLAAMRVAAVVTFWNAEGVALRRRGIPVREFRVDRYGAPRYPELVIATTRARLRDRRRLLTALVGALGEGTLAVMANRPAAVADIAKASGSDPALVRAQLAAVAPALRPPLRLDLARLREWAAFDARFGILRSAPDVGRAFEPLRP